MPFSLSNWLLRRKIDAQVRNSGRPVEHRRIAYPYHAVSVEAGPRACDAARALRGMRILSSEAPMLPLRDCAAPVCTCRYTHYNDRRSQVERRSQFPHPHAHQIHDRRLSSGRRITD